MKKIIYSILLLTFIWSCQRETGYKITGYIPDVKNGMKVYLENEQEEIYDSTTTQNGRFTFVGQVTYPERRIIRIDLSPEIADSYEKDLRGSEIYVDNSDIRYECSTIDSLPSLIYMTSNIKVPQGNVRISGSPAHELYQSYQNQIMQYATPKNELWERYLAEYHIPAGEDTAFHTRRGLEIVRQMKELNKKIRSIQLDFIKQNPKSAVSANIGIRYIYNTPLTNAEIKEVVELFDTTLNKCPDYLQMLEIAESIKPTAIGERYTDLKLTDIDGKTVHLSDYIQPGKYNMVEFWASWCGPCRYEIPHLRHIYEAYGDDFNIVSVSLNEKDPEWKQALSEEHMSWTQLCDPNGFEGEAGSKYKLNGIPFGIVIDPDGIIIAREVRGSELDQVLIDHIGYKFKE